MEVIGLDPRFDEGAHQRIQRLDVVVDALAAARVWLTSMTPAIREAPAGGAGRGESSRGWLAWTRDDDGLALGAQRARHRRASRARARRPACACASAASGRDRSRRALR